MHLANLDLNLLRVFDVLLEERSVTRAGARLGLTPSAVSHALSRLRYHLGDELFQRDRQGMQPTRKALEIGPSLHAALGQLQSALTPADFEPAVSDHRFSVVAGAYACAVLMPARLSPNCRPRRPACRVADHRESTRPDRTARQRSGGFRGLGVRFGAGAVCPRAADDRGAGLGGPRRPSALRARRGDARGFGRRASRGRGDPARGGGAPVDQPALKLGGPGRPRERASQARPAPAGRRGRPGHLLGHDHRRPVRDGGFDPAAPGAVVGPEWAAGADRAAL